MPQLPKVLFVIPPVRSQGDEFEYLVHLPRHAVVLAAELGEAYESHILDVTAEFHSRPARDEIDVCGSPGGLGKELLRLAPVLRDLVIDRISDLNPDIVVVHAHAAPHIPVVKLTFDAILEVLPNHRNTRVVCGGMAATHLAQVIADLAPDGTWIIRGEGTGRVRDLFDLVRGTRQHNPSTESISVLSGQRSLLNEPHANGDKAGQHFDGPRETTARVVDVIGNPLIMDYPLPRFDLLPMATYTKLFRNGDFVPHLEVSSGCTYQCKFCGVHYLGAERRYRRRPLSNVIEEIRHLRETYGFDEFYFCDETFTLDKKHVRELCTRFIRELPGIRWRCVTRVDRMDHGSSHDELAQLMFDAGCQEIGFGVEVGSNEVLQDNTKDATVDLNIETIKRVQRIGIHANALTILGMPQEDHSDIRRTFEFLARDAKPSRCQIFVFHPVPGTEYFLTPEVYGLRFDTRDVTEWYKWDHIGEAVCETKYLSQEDIARYFMLFNRAFATIINPEPDPELVRRVLANRFPVRRKRVTWLLEGGRLRIYRASDPSKHILNNSYSLGFSATHPHEKHNDRVHMAEYVLSRCNGLLTRSELETEVQRQFSHAFDAEYNPTGEILGLLQRMDVVTEF